MGFELFCARNMIDRIHITEAGISFGKHSCPHIKRGGFILVLYDSDTKRIAIKPTLIGTEGARKVTMQGTVTMRKFADHFRIKKQQYLTMEWKDNIYISDTARMIRGRKLNR